MKTIKESADEYANKAPSNIEVGAARRGYLAGARDALEMAKAKAATRRTDKADWLHGGLIEPQSSAVARAITEDIQALISEARGE